MTTLEQIRLNNLKNMEYKMRNEQNYKNPHAINLISKTLKKQNIELIEKLCDENGIDEETKKEWLEEFIKPNYYNPIILNSQKKEELVKYI